MDLLEARSYLNGACVVPLAYCPLHFCLHPQVTLSDKRSCFDQGISGHHLMKTSMLIKVCGPSLEGRDADEGKD